MICHEAYGGSLICLRQKEAGAMEFFLELMKCLSALLQVIKELIGLFQKHRNSRRR